MAGETTLVAHLGIASVHAWLKMAVIDLNPQESTATCSDRRDTDLLVVVCYDVTSSEGHAPRHQHV